MRRKDLRALGWAVAFLACIFLLAGNATAQQRTGQQPVTGQQTPLTPSPGNGPLIPSPGTASAAQTPPSGLSGAAGAVSALPDASDVGICQCIADRTTRRLSCLSSAAACQSTCASTHFAFTPHAIYSCANATTPESASAVMSPSR